MEDKNKAGRPVSGKKLKITKSTVKRYRIIVKYVEVDPEKAMIKRAIIERILKDIE